MKSKSVAVIGAGIGGLCAAIHLASRGMHVNVIEKNPHPGGRVDWIEREGHHFDTGPTLMVMQLLYAAEFRALGTPMEALLDLQQVDPTYRLIFDDGSQLALTSDMQSLRNQLESIEPGAFQGFLRYHAEGKRHYQLGMEKLVNRDFRRLTDLISLGNIPAIVFCRLNKQLLGASDIVSFNLHLGRHIIYYVTIINKPIALCHFQ